MNVHRPLAVRAALLAALLLPVTASLAGAWDFQTCLGSRRIMNRNPFTFQVSAISFPAGSPQRAALEAARASWNNAPGTVQRMNFLYTNTNSWSGGDGISSIIFASNYSYGSKLAVALWRWETCYAPNTGRIKEADILFNPAYSWNYSLNPTPWTTNTYNLTLVAIHELGHALGLQHENTVMTSMNAFYPNGGPLGNVNAAQPHGNDLLGNRTGYGGAGTAYDLVASYYQRTGGTGTSSPLLPPSTIYRGRTAEFPLTIENRGRQNVSAAQVRFYLSTDRTITSADTQLGAATFNLPSGRTLTPYVTVTIPPNQPTGTYYFGTIIDPTNTVAEADETNNAAAHVWPTAVSAQAPPVACFTPLFLDGPDILQVTFNANCSTDSDGFIAHYSWDFGDGGAAEGSIATHTFYYHPYWGGNSEVRLRVTDSSGLTSEQFGQVSLWCTGSGGVACN